MENVRLLLFGLLKLGLAELLAHIVQTKKETASIFAVWRRNFGQKLLLSGQKHVTLLGVGIINTSLEMHQGFKFAKNPN